MTVDLAPDERLGEALGYFGLTGLSMNAVAPAVVESLVARSGWEGAFASAAVAALLCGAFSIAIRETKRGAASMHRPLTTASLIRQPQMLNAALVMTGIGAAFASMFIFHQLYALELGIEQVRLFFITYAIAAIVARVGLPGLGDRWGRRPASIAALMLYTASVLAMTQLAWVGLAAIGAAFGFAHGVFYPTYSALVVEEVAVEARGRAVALLQAWFNVGIAGSAYGLGALAEHAGYVPVFTVAGACAALALIAVAGYRSGCRRDVSPALEACSPGRTRQPARQRG
jgi:predicted MFS family arabinose efflux permease